MKLIGIRIPNWNSHPINLFFEVIINLTLQAKFIELIKKYKGKNELGSSWNWAVSETKSFLYYFRSLQKFLIGHTCSVQKFLGLVRL